MRDFLKTIFTNAYVKRDGTEIATLVTSDIEESRRRRAWYRVYRNGTYGTVNQLAAFRTLGEAIAFAQAV